jgi:hypothetical protein
LVFDVAKGIRFPPRTAHVGKSCPLQGLFNLTLSKIANLTSKEPLPFAVMRRDRLQESTPT